MKTSKNKLLPVKFQKSIFILLSNFIYKIILIYKHAKANNYFLRHSVCFMSIVLLADMCIEGPQLFLMRFQLYFVCNMCSELSTLSINMYRMQYRQLHLMSISQRLLGMCK